METRHSLSYEFFFFKNPLEVSQDATLVIRLQMCFTLLRGGELEHPHLPPPPPAPPPPLPAGAETHPCAPHGGGRMEY